MVALLAILALLLLPSTAAALPEPPAFKSNNVSWLATLDEPNAVSARIRGTTMFVSTFRGLSVYDIQDPAKPKKIGALDLPHFENEDVDLGGDILLISNDPSEGKGVLYIIDIKDPTKPKVLSQFDTGIIFGSELEFFFGFPTTGTGHTASCVQNCRYAYLAGTVAGIDIVDLTDPKNPKRAGNFRATEASGELATHDVQFDQAGNAWIVGAGGTAGYDISNPLAPRLLYKTDESGKSKLGIAPTDGKNLNDFIHHNSMRLRNSSLLDLPVDLPLGADSDVVVVTEEDYNRPACEGAGQLETWRIGADGVLRNLASYVVDPDPSKTTLCSAHYFDERGGLLAQGWYEAGTRFFDITDPKQIRPVGYWIPSKNMTWSTYFAPNDESGQVLYSLDNARGIDVLRINRGAPPDPGPPPQGDAGDPGAGAPGGSSGSGAPARRAGSASLRPNVRLRVGNRRKRVRPRQRVVYRLNVRNTSDVETTDVKVQVDFPRSLRYVRGGKLNRRARRVSFELDRLESKGTRVFKLVAKVARRPGSRGVELPVALTARGDFNPRDNYGVDRDQVARSKSRGNGGSGRDSSRRARASSLARATSRMPTVPSPLITAEAAEDFVATFGRLCRLLVASS